jgi:hypothetical protein
MYFSNEGSETKAITKFWVTISNYLCKSLTGTFVIVIPKWWINKIRLHLPLGTYCLAAANCHSISQPYLENQWQLNTSGSPDGQVQWLVHKRRCRPETKAVIWFLQQWSSDRQQLWKYWVRRHVQLTQGYRIFEGMCIGLTVLNYYKFCPTFIRNEGRPLMMDIIIADNCVWLWL